MLKKENLVKLNFSRFHHEIAIIEILKSFKTIIRKLKKTLIQIGEIFKNDLKLLQIIVQF